MKLRAIVLLVLASLIIGAAIAPALAQQVPNVSGLEPFSAEANFMSLPGYLRWLLFQQNGSWITYEEAARMVQQQTGQAP